MMEENVDILLDGCDDLVYLSDQCTKNIPQHLFGAIHLERTYLTTDFMTFCVRDSIDLILFSPILTLLICHSFLILLFPQKFKD